MSAATKSMTDVFHAPLGALAVAALACVVGIGILGGGSLAVLGLLGVIAFFFFLQRPHIGLYFTATLLLLSGPIGEVLTIGGASVTGGKLCGAATRPRSSIRAT